MSRAVLQSTGVAGRTASSPTPLRVAVVGCGAVTKANLLPVLAGHDGLSVAALVDRDLSRAEELARAYGVARAVRDLDGVLDDVEAVVLATPPAHHAPATIDLAGRGKHVFVEKPMATTAADAARMVAAAESAGVTLAVGLYRRMLPSVRLLRALLESGEYGRPLSVDAEEGGPYGWKLAALDVLTKSGGGGGVLIDIGTHLIDVVLHALPGRPTLTRYEDNERGGIETDCVARFTIAIGRTEIPARVELSRTRELRGTIRVACEGATLELERANFTQVVVHPAGREGSAGSSPSPFRITAGYADQKPYVGFQAFRDEIDDWISGIQTGTATNLSGRSVLPVVQLIDDCYQTRRPTLEPWTDEGLTALPSHSRSTRRRRVLITGAGGFLGGRAAELLSNRYGWDVTALVREPGSAARLARWSQPIVVGDICSPADMDRVLKDHDAVVHCAVGTSWQADASRKVTVEGTRVVAEAALGAGVQRFVHISTMFVHERQGGGILDERVALAPSATDSYGQNKLAAEAEVRKVTGKGLSSIILRPTRIYGAFSKTFTIRPLEAISAGRFAIRGDAGVPANMVYVDNVVEAIARALEAPETLGGSAYLISDPEQASLREFYEYFARAAGLTISLSPRERAKDTEPTARGLGRWVSGIRTIATSPQLRALVRRVLDTDPIGTLPRRLWDRSPALQQSLLRRFGADAAVIYRPAADRAAADLVYYGEPARVSAEKAKEELGFEGSVSRERAMALTLEWARYARLLPSEH